MTVAPETLTAFRTMLASARTLSPIEPADCDTFCGLGGVDLVRAVAGVTDALPAATATAFLGTMAGCVADVPEGYPVAPVQVARPCSYGQAAQLLAAQLGLAL